MEYYHGTDKNFDFFDLNAALIYKDFGRGMYLAQEYWHAEAIALGKNGEHAYVRVYEINSDDMRKYLSVKLFKKKSINWVKYIIENRSKVLVPEYDVVEGITADSDAQDKIETFCRTHKTRVPSIKEYKELISKLRPDVYPIQMALLTQRAIDYVEKQYVKTILVK